MLKFISALAIFVLVAACDTSSANQYRTQGAGLSLYMPQTARNTDNLTKYFAALCKQAGFQSQSCAPAPGAMHPGNWRLLVETGYNDIDYRCDSYLSWIDSKRSERILFEGTTNAISTLTAGLLKGSSASAGQLADIALVLGFTRDLYDSYQSSILLGLEGSTIKEIVNQRRSTHRKTFQNARYDDRAEAVFALRRYLTYCTPQSILTDVNSFSRGAASGTLPPITSEASAAAAVIGARAPSNPGRRNTGSIPRTSEIAADDLAFGPNQVRRLQSAACLNPDGVVGPDTKEAVALMHSFRDGMDSDTTKLNASEWGAHAQFLRPCDTANFKNLFENIDIGQAGDLGRSTVASLTQNDNFSDDLRGKTLNDPLVRAEIAKNRERLGVDETSFGISKTSDQLSRALVTRLLAGE